MPKLKDMTDEELGVLYTKVSKSIKSKLNRGFGGYPSESEFDLRARIMEEVDRRNPSRNGQEDIRDGLQELWDSARKESEARQAGHYGKEEAEGQGEGEQGEGQEGSSGVQGGEPS